MASQVGVRSDKGALCKCDVLTESLKDSILVSQSSDASQMSVSSWPCIVYPGEQTDTNLREKMLVLICL